jgi:hypothetical protein
MHQTVLALQTPKMITSQPVEQAKMVLHGVALPAMARSRPGEHRRVAVGAQLQLPKLDVPPGIMYLAAAHAHTLLMVSPAFRQNAMLGTGRGDHCIQIS